jgi:hypothetical protein
MSDLPIPQRAVRLTLKMEADTREALASALFNMAARIDRGEMTAGVSGGYDSGYIYELIERDRPTHDEYFAALNAYLDRESTARAAVAQPGAGRPDLPIPDPGRAAGAPQDGSGPTA